MRSVLAVLVASTLSLQAQPGVQTFTLPNGLRVLHLEEHGHPLMRARLCLSFDSGAVPPGRQGLPELFQRLFDHAETADLKAGELDRMLDDSGIQLAQSPGVDGISWRLVARSRDQDRALALLADRLLRTLLDATTLETQRLACLHLLDHPEEAPHQRLLAALTLDPAARPSRSSLGAITLQDVLAFRARSVRPDRAILIIHGDLGLEQAKRLVLQSLGTWTAPPLPAPVSPPPATTSSPPPYVPAEAPRITSPDSAIRVQAVAPRPGELAQEVVELLKVLLPGDASLPPVRMAVEDDRLVATLDGESGLPGSAAWTLLHERLATLSQREFLPVDLERARAIWLARRSLDSLHPEAQMDRALAAALGRGVTESQLMALPLAALNAGLSHWLDPAQLRFGAAGEPDLLKTLPTR